jgi:hypothetical protein
VRIAGQEGQQNSKADGEDGHSQQACFASVGIGRT